MPICARLRRDPGLCFVGAAGRRGMVSRTKVLEEKLLLSFSSFLSSIKFYDTYMYHLNLLAERIKAKQTAIQYIHSLVTTVNNSTSDKP